MSEPDHILLERLARGDRAAFQELYEAHVRPVYAVALRVTGNYEDAEETTQDAFLQLAGQKKNAATIRDVRGWLIRCAVRRAIDLLRRRKVRPELVAELHELLPLDALASRAQRADDALAGKELSERVRELVQTLPERQAVAFALRHFHSMSIAEVAAAMECSAGAVKSHLHIGTAKLRERLKAEGFLGAEKTPRREAQS